MTDTFHATDPFVDGLAAVEASAGTGKTWSITSLVVRLVVEEGLSIDRILVVTFTRAATAELVDRVRRRLRDAAGALRTGEAPSGDAVLDGLLASAERLPGGRPEGLRRVERALRDVDEAAIQTLHGFCQRILQQAALVAGAEPAVTVDGDREASLLLEEVVGDWHVALVRDAPAAFVTALHTLRLRRDDLLALARTAVAEHDVPVVPPPVPDASPDPAGDVERALAACRQALHEAEVGDVAWQVEHGITHRSYKVGPVRLPQERGAMLAAMEDDRVPTAKELRAYRTLLSERLVDKGVPPAPSMRAVDDLVAALTRVEQQLRDRLVAHVRDEVPRRRLVEARIGFEGLLREVDRAVTDPERRAALVRVVGGAYDAVFVDEFQDTDPVQWGVLRGLLGDARRFVVVGDPKQAIYGWRGADLRTYLDAVREARQKRTMEVNWRSDGPYVEACNRLLAAGRAVDGARVFGTDEIDYVQVEAQPDHGDPRLHDADGNPRSGLHLVLHEREDEGSPTGLGVGRRHVAACTAEDVVATLAGGWTITDRGSRRGVGPGDCVVLVRSNQEARLVAGALRERGVQPTLGGGQDVFASDEAADVQHLLAALLDRTHDPLVRRVLVGPFAALDASALDALDDAARDAWAERLRGWHDVWQRHGVAALLEQAAREGGAERRLVARPDGERILTNVRHLAELLQLAARQEALGTHALLSWLRARRADALSDTGRAPVERELRLERDEDAVRVLTVHAAKGLEFPLVWAPFLWSSEVRARHNGNRHRAFVVNDPAADGRRTLVNHACALLQEDEAPEQLQALWRAKDLADWQSGLRLAYVALTRAEHRCVVHTGAFRDVVGSSAWHLLHALAGHTTYRPGAKPTQVRATDHELLVPLHALAEHDAVTVEGRGPTPPAATRWDPPVPTTADELQVADWGGRTLDRAWGRTSFTALLRRRWAPDPLDASAADEVDHDQGTAGDAPDRTRGAAPGGRDGALDEPVPLRDVPRGAAWGTFLHGVLEHADFSADRDDLLQLVRDEARLGPLTTSPAHHTTVADGLHAALHTPLGGPLGDLRLADVTREHRLDELRFTLALAGAERPVSVRALADVLDRHDASHPGVPLAASAAHLRAEGDGPAVHGLLVGAIDLVLREHAAGGPRWWVVDYKSNGLGRWVDDPDGGRRWVEVAADHHPDLVLDAMVHHDYLLQAHLYVVALHRHLRSRLGDAYDYDTHMGGWAYLFLRGMTGPHVVRTDDGRSHGVATGRPSRALVDDLETVLLPSGGPT